MNDPLLLNLKKQYRLRNPQLLKHAEHGYSGVNFYITDGATRYFVKAYNPSITRQDLRIIHRAHFFYYRRGIPVIVPIRTTTGGSFIAYQDRLYALFPYKEGKGFEGMPNERIVSSMGAMLARIHHFGMHNWAIVRRKEFISWPDSEKEADTILRHIAALPTQTALDNEMRNFVEYKRSLSHTYQNEYHDLDFKKDCIIHGDFHLYNVFLHDDDTVAYVFDFDRVMRGPRATEVVYSLFLICFDFSKLYTDEEREQQFSLAKVFLEAYQELFPLSRRELDKAIRWYFLGDLARTHWIEFQHYIGHNERAHLLLTERSNRLTYIAEHFAEIQERLLGYANTKSCDELPLENQSWWHTLFASLGIAHRAHVKK